MRDSYLVHQVVLVSVAILGACDSDIPTTSGPRVAIAVRPLELDGVAGATWRVTVKNGSSAVVWSAELASETYGDDAGNLAYVAPCDANDNDNLVSLELLALRTADDTLEDGVDFVNPARPGKPVSHAVTCVENADVPVVFELTVLRRAQQGFFDVAVDFEDIFCSAKIDCNATLLFDPLSGRRARTIVLGFACAAGQGEPTWLHHDDVVVTCDGLASPIVVDPSRGPGQLDPPYPGPPPNVTDVLSQAAIYRGREQVGDAQGIRKAYWNVALGINEAALATAGMCTLTSAATASAEPWTDGMPPDDILWPVVGWDLVVIAGGDIACDEAGLDEGGAVATAYATGRPYDASFDPATDAVVPHGAAPPGSGLIAFSAVNAGGDRELWFSDCSAENTWQVELNPNHSTPFDRDACLEDEYPNYECEWFEEECRWNPDGPYCGTSGSSAPRGFTRFGGHLYFTADDGVHGRELWRTDGLVSEMVDDLSPGSASSFDVGGEPDVYAASELAEIGGKLYLFAHDPDHGNEVFVTDGSVGPGAITLAADLRAGSPGSTPSGWLRAGTLRAAFRQLEGPEQYWLVDGDGSVRLVEYDGGRPPFDRSDSGVAVGNRILFTTWGQGQGDRTRLWLLDPGTIVARQIAYDIGVGCAATLAGVDYVVCPFPGYSDQDQSWCRLTTTGLEPVATAVDHFFRECSQPWAIGSRLFWVARYMDLDRHLVSSFDGAETTRLDLDSYFAIPGAGGYVAQTNAGLSRIDAATLLATSIYTGRPPDSFGDFPSASRVVVAASPTDLDPPNRQLGCIDVSNPSAAALVTIELSPNDADPRSFTELP